MGLDDLINVSLNILKDFLDYLSGVISDTGGGKLRLKVFTYHAWLNSCPPSSSGSYRALIFFMPPNAPFKSYIRVLGVKVSVPSGAIPGLKRMSWFTGDSASGGYVK